MSRSQDFIELRKSMVEDQLKFRGIKNPLVLEAMLKVPRHEFVPENMRSYAYKDEPLPIGEGQTISQPYIVAYMTEALELEPASKVLEIGTGSGYQSAVLAEIVSELYTVELVESLSVHAQEVLRKQSYSNINFRIGDGSKGWPESAPFDAVIVTAAPPRVPEALRDQLKIGGRMIIPVGEAFQDLVLVKREHRSFKSKSLLHVRFVPLVSIH